jgi:hypothetical protein
VVAGELSDARGRCASCWGESKCRVLGWYFWASRYCEYIAGQDLAGTSRCQNRRKVP